MSDSLELKKKVHDLVEQKIRSQLDLEYKKKLNEKLNEMIELEKNKIHSELNKKLSVEFEQKKNSELENINKELNDHKQKIYVLENLKLKRKYDLQFENNNNVEYKSYIFDDVLDKVDFRENLYEIQNQGVISCSASCAIVGAFQKNITFPSALFLNNKHLFVSNYEGKKTLLNCLKCCNNAGMVEEKEYPFIISKYLEIPYFSLSHVSVKNNKTKFSSLKQDLVIFKKCLTSKNLFVFSMKVFDSFENVGKDGLIKLPDENDVYLGIHAVLCCGYDNDKKHFIIRNCFGQKWGDDGYGYIPYDYILDSDLCRDFFEIIPYFLRK